MSNKLDKKKLSSLRLEFHYDKETGIFIRIKTNKILNFGKNKYKSVSFNGVNYKLHRLIWIYVTGVIPEVIDHINGDTHDNRFINLRNTTKQINCRNQKKRKNNKSGITGVCWSNKDKKWISQIRIDNGLGL